MAENEIADMLKKAGVPAIRFTATRGTASSLSTIGGLPDVPQGFEWPAWKGTPLAFLAQIDLSTIQAVHSLSGLPNKGILYFFYDQEQSTWGFDPADRGSWRVLYEAGSRDLRRAVPPDELSADFIYHEKRVTPIPILSLPSYERLRVDLTTVSEEMLNAAEKLRTETARGEPEHQIGGFPNPVQGDEMELECQLATNGLYCGDASGYEDPRASELRKGASEWRLLLQIDTDDDTGMIWGDCGRLYFWIRAMDLATKDFSSVWMVLQCY